MSEAVRICEIGRRCSDCGLSGYYGHVVVSVAAQSGLPISGPAFAVPIATFRPEVLENDRLVASALVAGSDERDKVSSGLCANTNPNGTERNPQE